MKISFLKIVKFLSFDVESLSVQCRDTSDLWTHVAVISLEYRYVFYILGLLTQWQHMCATHDPKIPGLNPVWVAVV